jgi:hypothetical protein
MKKRIVGIFVMALLITSSFLPIIIAEQKNEKEIGALNQNSYNVGSINVFQYDATIDPNDIEIKILKTQLPKYVTIVVNYELDERGTGCTGYCSMEIVNTGEKDEKSTSDWDKGELHINILVNDGDSFSVKLVGGYQCPMSQAESQDFASVTVKGIKGKNNIEDGNLLLFRFLENHPLMFPLLQMILGM